MTKARVRVEAKKLPPNASRQDREYQLVRLLRIFKRMCNEYGIPAAYKEHEFFVRKCDKRRRKRMAKKAAARQEGTDKIQEGDNV
jgi:ribosomal protein S21